MSKIFRSQQETHILQAVEQNFTEEMAMFGRALPDAELQESSELTYLFTGPHGPNVVLLTDIEADDPCEVEVRITDVKKYYQQRGLTHFDWIIGPTSYPPDLPNILENCSFQHRDTTSCMMTEVAAPRPPLDMPAGLSIREVTTSAELVQKCQIEAQCFEMGTATKHNYRLAYTQSGFGAGQSWHHYVGWLESRPVAIASVLLHAGIAGIYNIGTLKQVRQRGIGTAMIQYLLAQIEQSGYAVVMLFPSGYTQKLYQRLGFHECCQLYHYTYYFPTEEEQSVLGPAEKALKDSKQDNHA